MSIFKWIPEDSSQVVSPWIALFLVIVVVVTALTWWGFNRVLLANKWDDGGSGLGSGKASIELKRFQFDVEKAHGARESKISDDN
jgi:hypothetical protein